MIGVSKVNGQLLPRRPYYSILEQAKLYYVMDPQYGVSKKPFQPLLSSPSSTSIDWENHFRKSPLSNRYLARNTELKFQRVHFSSFTSNLVVQDYFKQFHPQPISIFGLGDFNPFDLYMVFPKVIINW